MGTRRPSGFLPIQRDTRIAPKEDLRITQRVLGFGEPWKSRLRIAMGCSSRFKDLLLRPLVDASETGDVKFAEWAGKSSPCMEGMFQTLRGSIHFQSEDPGPAHPSRAPTSSSGYTWVLRVLLYRDFGLYAWTVMVLGAVRLCKEHLNNFPELSTSGKFCSNQQLVL